MRILFLHTDSFGGFGGIAKFNRDFMTAACSCREVEMVALPRLVERKEEAQQVSIPGLILDLSGVNGKFRFVFAALCAAKKYGPFDKVICGHINLLPLARLCARGEAELGLIIHGIEVWKPSGSSLVNSAVKKIDFFVSVSDFTRRKFCEWSRIPQEKGFILPNCIELEKFGPGPKDEDLLMCYGLTGKQIILTVGRMSATERYKGFDEILEVLPELMLDVPDIAYLVVGDGNDRPRLEQKTHELGVADRVVFAGRIDEKEKVAHYRLADVFAMPGRGEGFGIVYLEAMACGIPVIASSKDASREAVRDGLLGTVVDPDNHEELIQELREGLMKKKAVPKGLEYFAFENYNNMLRIMLDRKVN
jgi:glycosyltransferase involved in cell wall biosynthesis